MELSASDIKQFQELYMTKFGIQLDAKAARHKLLELVRQMATVYLPITNEQLQAYEAKNEHEDTKSEQARATSDS